MTASHRAQSTIDKSITPPTAQDADRHAASLSGQHDKPAALTLDECRDHLDAGEITLLRWCFEDAGSDGREGYGGDTVFLEVGRMPGITPDDAEYFRQHPVERHRYRPVTPSELESAGETGVTDVLVRGPLTWRKCRTLLRRVVRS